MKVVTAKEMARIEKLAYQKGASEEEFMEAAGKEIAREIQHFIAQKHLKPHILIICGGGNNGGDGYVAARILHEGEFHVKAISLHSFDRCSPLSQKMSLKFQGAGGDIDYISQAEDLSFKGYDLIVDGILGTGFHGQLDPFFRSVIEKMNGSNLPILAIDIPSGINGTTGEIGGGCVHASKTLFLGLPKRGCFVGEAWNHTGDVAVLDFGLQKEFIDQAHADFLMIHDEMILKDLPLLVRNRHKYQSGYVVGLGGCPDMPGAPIMSCYAALRAGAGIVRLLHPSDMQKQLAFAPYEVIRQEYEKGDAKTVLKEMQKATSVFVGPGIGVSNDILKLLKKVLPAIAKPCVIDAEALFLLAKHHMDLPKETIMTPHTGEMLHLLGIEEKIPMEEMIQRSYEYSNEKNVTLVLKGSPTFIFHPGETPHMCVRGDPGMATAGSGDVLTGIISAFLSQTKDRLKAAILGVQFHAVAGELAAEKYTSYCMIATDIVKCLPQVFKHYHRN